MFDAIEAKLYVQRKRLPPKPLEKLEKGVLTRTQEVDSTDSINRNVLIQIAGRQDQGASVQKTVWTVMSCRYMEVYFHFYWLWWAALCYIGLYWAVLVCIWLHWAVLGCSGM